MASTFPGAIDSFTDPLSGSPLNSPSHSAQHADLNDAVEKIETYVLARPKGIVAYTSNATTTISGGYLTGLNTTFTFLANRYYRISTASEYAISGDILVEIHLDATSVQRIFDSRFATRASTFVNIQGMWVGTVAAGSKTAKLAVTLLSGTVSNGASATMPNQLIIEDMGAV